MYTMIISKGEKVEIIESNDWIELCQKAYQAESGSRVQYWDNNKNDWVDFYNDYPSNPVKQ